MTDATNDTTTAGADGSSDDAPDELDPSTELYGCAVSDSCGQTVLHPTRDRYLDVVKELANDRPAHRPRRRRRKPDWTEAVEVASGDPEDPPETWEKGQLAWAEAVYEARRQVDRGRKAMLNALKAMAG